MGRKHFSAVRFALVYVAGCCVGSLLAAIAGASLLVAFFVTWAAGMAALFSVIHPQDFYERWFGIGEENDGEN